MSYPPEPNPLLVVLSGPSGAGKDTVLKRMKESGYPFHFVVTATDRPRRPGEVHGVDYYFLSTEQFTWSTPLSTVNIKVFPRLRYARL